MRRAGTSALAGMLSLAAVLAEPLPTTILGIAGYIFGGILVGALFALAAVDMVRIARAK